MISDSKARCCYCNDEETAYAMNKKDTMVTIGIPLFNGKKNSRERNLATILEQDYENVEHSIRGRCRL